jgi:large subunit ribosomal protein L21
MYAILETGSRQYKVEEGDVLEVDLLEDDRISADNTVHFDRVLLVKNDELYIGQPFVKEARIQAKVLDEFKGEKIIVFKKKAKKQYKRTRGHRQRLHRIQVEKIELTPSVKAEAAVEKPKSSPAPKETQAQEQSQPGEKKEKD